MSSDIKIKIPKTIEGPDGLPVKPRILVAVSGGMDSMVLLHAVAQEFSKEDFAVAHFNHRTRGKENEEDASLVRKASEELGVEFYHGSRQQIGPAPEEVLRNLRREFMESIAEKHDFDFICTAHHANDQLETVLMRLLRGTDWRGMGGIRERAGKWLRPLLTVSRENIERYAKKNAVAYRQDLSNYNARYFRNAIRHGAAQELLQVAENFGMSRQAALDNVSEWCRRGVEVQDYLDEQVKRLVDELAVQTPFWVRVSCEAWDQVPKPLKAHVLNQMSERFLGKTVCRKQLKLWQKHIRQGQKRFHLKDGIKVRVSMGYWYLLLDKEAPEASPERGENGIFHFEEIKTDLKILVPNLEHSWEARYYEAGDRLASSGKKLKEIFQRRRIPAPERKLIPVLARPSTSQVLWYLGSEESLLEVSTARCDFPFLQS
jgi:tRNA(Ile)-lysidine synthetase-like protein